MSRESLAMRINEAADNSVRRTVVEYAEHVAAEFGGPEAKAYDVWNEIERYCEDKLFGSRSTAMLVIGRYGWADALKGGVDYEDSPLHMFEDDVYSEVERILEDEGTAIV